MERKGQKLGRVERRKERDWCLQNIKQCTLVFCFVLPNQVCFPGHSGSPDRAAYCGKGQGRRVSNSLLGAGCLPPSPAGCGRSVECLVLAGTLEESTAGKSNQELKGSVLISDRNP